MKRKEYLLLLLVIVIGVFFRFNLIKEVPLGLYPDEAMNGNNALEALSTGPLAGGFKMFYPENNGREGLFINIQAISVRIFGNQPWALRGVSALFGVLTIWGLYLVTRELLNKFGKKGHWIALLSSFFLATSYWHINFSRIGFRAIMVPFAAVFALYFLLEGFRTGRTLSLILAGVFMGVGLNTYIAFRFVPFVMAVPILFYFLPRWKEHQTRKAVIIFLLATFIVSLPIGLYFLKNPADFLGRGGQVSVFAASSPALEFVKTNVVTLGMFFVYGDCNWRHNYNCQPELNPLVTVFFAIGLWLALKNIFKPKLLERQTSALLLAWMFFMSLPATLTREGLPHALRSIGMIPPTMILAGLGAWYILNMVFRRLEWSKDKYENYGRQIERIKKEVMVLFCLVLLAIPVMTYRDYFRRWAYNPATYYEFNTDLLHIGQYLNNLSPDTKKYVVVNRDSGVKVYGLPMPAQTVMYATNTFVDAEREKKNYVYLLPDQIDRISIEPGRRTVVSFLKVEDLEFIKSVQKKYPELRVSVPSDFVVLQDF